MERLRQTKMWRRRKDIYFRTGNFISPASDANSGISPPPGSIAEYEQWSKEKANMAAEQLEAEIAADRREFEQSAGREYNSRGAEVPRGIPCALAETVSAGGGEHGGGARGDVEEASAVEGTPDQSARRRVFCEGLLIVSCR